MHTHWFVGWGKKGSIAQRLAYLLLDPAAPGLIPKVSETFSEDFAKVNQWHCLKESGQWLENGDQTHLVLASDK